MLIIVDIATTSGMTLHGAAFEVKKTLLHGFPDLLGIQIFLRPDCIDYYTWFISALLWASVAVYYLLLKKRNFYIYIFAPFILLLTIGFFHKTSGHIDQSIYLSGFFRAFAELGVGCILYHIYKFLLPRLYRINAVFLTVTEGALLVGIFIIMYRTRHDYKDFLVLFMIAALILVTFLNKGYITRLLNRKVFGYMGTISLVMYLNQRSFHYIGYRLFPNNSFWTTTIILFIALTLYSALITFLMNKIISVFKNKKTSVS